jgi:hypothetical protein
VCISPGLCAGSSVHPFAECGRGDPKRLRQFGYIPDAGISKPAFDAADVRGIKARTFSEIPLSKLLRLALAADIQPQRSKDSVTFRHD